MRGVVDDRYAVPQLDFVAGHADDTLDDVFLGVEREVEDDDVVLRHFAIGEQPSPDAGAAKRRLVDEQKVADEQGALHAL